MQWLKSHTQKLTYGKEGGRKAYDLSLDFSAAAKNAGVLSEDLNGTGLNSADNTKAHLRASLKKVRDQRQRLSRQYLWSYMGMLTLHVVLMIFGVSLFALALRSLLSLDGLIPTALVLFTLGSAGLLVGTGCILIDLAQGSSGSDSLGQSLGKALTQMILPMARQSMAQNKCRQAKAMWVRKAAHASRSH